MRWGVMWSLAEVSVQTLQGDTDGWQRDVLGTGNRAITIHVAHASLTIRMPACWCQVG